MATQGAAPGGIQQTAAPAMFKSAVKKPVLGQPAGSVPALQPGGDLGTRTNPVLYGQPATAPAPAGGSGSGGGTIRLNDGTNARPGDPAYSANSGWSAVTKPPLTETAPALGGGYPVTTMPVAAAPFPVNAPKTAPAPLNLEQTLTNQFQTGAPSNPRLGATQGLVDQAAQGLTGGPDRTQIAQQAFSDYLSQSGDQFNKDIRAITQRNAAAGRLGSGMYGSDLVDAATAADKNRAYAGNQLAQDLANGTISDQFNRVGVLGNLENQQFGQGQTQLNNLLGYGQQGFQNQLATQQQQQAIDDQQFRQYLALLGLNAG